MKLDAMIGLGIRPGIIVAMDGMILGTMAFTAGIPLGITAVTVGMIPGIHRGIRLGTPTGTIPGDTMLGTMVRITPCMVVA